MLCLAVQSSLTLCDLTNCNPPGSSVRGDSPGKNTAVGCHTVLQGIFPIQGLNPGLRTVGRFFTILATWEPHDALGIHLQGASQVTQW